MAQYRFPSRFIFDVDKPLLDYKQELPEHLVNLAKNYINQSDAALKLMSQKAELEPGMRVTHAILGRGTVEEVDSKAKTYLIKFDTIPTPRKMSWKAPVKKLEE